MDDDLFIRARDLRTDHDYASGFFGPAPAMAGSTAPEIDQNTQTSSLDFSEGF